MTVKSVLLLLNTAYVPSNQFSQITLFTFIITISNSPSPPIWGWDTIGGWPGWP